MNKRFFFTFLFFFVGLFLFSTGDTSIGVRLAEKLKSTGINPYIVIFLISTLPIVELRGAIPIGILFFKLNWFWVVVVSIIGNILPIFFVLYLFKFVEKLLRHLKIFNTFFDWLFSKTMAKSKKIEKYEELGLMFFVGIPLPATGAWTGSLIAYLIQLAYFKAIIFIFLGVLLAACIVSAMTYFGLPGVIVGFSILSVITGMGIVIEKIKK